MRFTIPVIALALCAFSGTANGQDPIQELVNQARRLANPPVIQSTGNATFPEGSGRLGLPASPRVGFSESAIEIELPGRSFRIPRSAGPEWPIGATPPVAGPPVTSPLPPGEGGEQALSEAARQLAAAEAVQLFQRGDYGAARERIQPVLENSESVRWHAFGSLVHFATGDIDYAAQYAYSSAASGRMWDWSTLQGLYGNLDDYARQYEAVQRLARSADGAATRNARFVAGCHHLMLGHDQHALQVLGSVSAELPEDPVISALLERARQGTPKPPQPLR